VSPAEPTGLLRVRVPFVDVTPLVVDRGVDFEGTDLREGQKLTVMFRGEAVTVYVVPCPDGRPECWYARGWGRYIYQGVRHKTLTSIARLVVGPSDPRINGHRFFGLRRRRRGPS
jgi:hypothetical protein